MRGGVNASWGMVFGSIVCPSISPSLVAMRTRSRSQAACRMPLIHSTRRTRRFSMISWAAVSLSTINSMKGLYLGSFMVALAHFDHVGLCRKVIRGRGWPELMGILKRNLPKCGIFTNPTSWSCANSSGKTSLTTMCTSARLAPSFLAIAVEIDSTVTDFSFFAAISREYHAIVWVFWKQSLLEI